MMLFYFVILTAMHDIRGQLPHEMHMYCTGGYNPNVLKSTHIDPLIKRSSTMPPPKDRIMQFSGK